MQVNVVVAPADDPPTAVDDMFTITEDAAEATFDVQSNDTSDGDGQAFVLNSVGTPSAGGSARVSSDGSQFFYQPAANFNGTETVSYTIRDTGGGLAIGTATFTVNAVNDPPPILDTTVSVNRDSGESEVFDLSDLGENPDSGETLVISETGTTSQGGTVRLDQANGKIFYTPPAAFSGTDSFTYTIEEQVNGTAGLTATGTITVEVLDFTERDILLSFCSHRF